MLGELINRASRLQDSLAIREKDWRAGLTSTPCMFAVADEHFEQAMVLRKQLDQSRDQEQMVAAILTKIFAQAKALKNEASQKNS